MTLIQILVAIVLLVSLFVLIQVGAVSIAFGKLGLSMGSAMLLLASSIVGSGINLPMFTLKNPDGDAPARELPGLLDDLLPAYRGKTVIAMNVGGGLIPVAFCIYLYRHNPLPPGALGIATAAVAAVAYLLSRPIPRVGIGMPALACPLAAALIALLLAPEQSAPLAYMSGTLGVLIGADLLRLKDIAQLRAPIAAIGGAGTFDGVFITGIIAVLLA